MELEETNMHKTLDELPFPLMPYTENIFYEEYALYTISSNMKLTGNIVSFTFKLLAATHVIFLRRRKKKKISVKLFIVIRNSSHTLAGFCVG
jgi:hypothetical protein